MPFYIAVIAAVVVASGFGALVGLLIGGRSPQRVATGETDSGVVVADAPPRSRRVGLVDVVPKGYLGMLERQLVLAGRPLKWSVDKILIAKPVLVVVGGVLAAWWISGDPGTVRIGLGVFLILLCFFVPDLLIYSRAQERQARLQLELPDTLDQMTISVEAGLGFEGAMAKAGSNGRGPLAEELIRTLQDMSIGRTRKDAYEALGERTSSVDLRRFTRSVVQADLYGIAIADVLRVQASEMRLKRRQRAEEKAMKIPVKVLFPLVFCILPVLFIVLMTPAVIGIAKVFIH
ncbi:MAG: tight adherence protein [Microbacteriaceae bacterium]|jgi:tight adherence protein C|nr:tight adherence protein [Microbacteriaceae bacterium]